MRNSVLHRPLGESGSIRKLLMAQRNRLALSGAENGQVDEIVRTPLSPTRPPHAANAGPTRRKPNPSRRAVFARVAHYQIALQPPVARAPFDDRSRLDVVEAAVAPD